MSSLRFVLSLPALLVLAACAIPKPQLMQPTEALKGATVYITPHVELTQDGRWLEEWLAGELTKCISGQLTGVGVRQVRESKRPHDFVVTILADAAENTWMGNPRVHLTTPSGEKVTEYRYVNPKGNSCMWLNESPSVACESYCAFTTRAVNALLSTPRLANVRPSQAPVAKAAPPAPEQKHPEGREFIRADGAVVALLPLAVRGNEVDANAREALEEAVRTVAGDSLSPLGYTVLTGENTLQVLADNNVDPSKACEASCAMEAARELKATLFMSGGITKTEGLYVSFVRLFEQERGRQLASVQLEGATVRDLRHQFQSRADGFFDRGLKALEEIRRYDRKK